MVTPTHPMSTRCFSESVMLLYSPPSTPPCLHCAFPIPAECDISPASRPPPSSISELSFCCRFHSQPHPGPPPPFSAQSHSLVPSPLHIPLRPPPSPHPTWIMTGTTPSSPTSLSHSRGQLLTRALSSSHQQLTQYAHHERMLDINPSHCRIGQAVMTEEERTGLEIQRDDSTDRGKSDTAERRSTTPQNDLLQGRLVSALPHPTSLAPLRPLLSDRLFPLWSLLVPSSSLGRSLPLRPHLPSMNPRSLQTPLCQLLPSPLLLPTPRLLPPQQGQMPLSQLSALPYTLLHCAPTPSHPPSSIIPPLTPSLAPRRPPPIPPLIPLPPPTNQPEPPLGLSLPSPVASGLLTTTSVFVPPVYGEDSPASEALIAAVLTPPPPPPVEVVAPAGSKTARGVKGGAKRVRQVNEDRCRDIQHKCRSTRSM